MLTLLPLENGVLIWAREAIFAQMLTRATLVVEEPEHTDKTGLQEIRHAWTENIILIWQVITWQKRNAKIGDLQHHRNQWACICHCHSYHRNNWYKMKDTCSESLQWQCVLWTERFLYKLFVCLFFLFVWEGGILWHFVIIHLNGLDCQSCQNICLYRVCPHTWSTNHAIS